jgi:hypothetical protein
VGDSRSWKVTERLMVWATVSKVRVAKPVPGLAFPGFSFAPESVVL